MYSVYYNVFDNDHTLFVKLTDHINKNETTVYTGTQKECRLYVIQNQKKAPTPELKKTCCSRESLNGLPTIEK